MDGKLKKATKIKDIKNFSAKDFRLKPIRVVEMGPFVFAFLGDGEPRFNLLEEYISAHNLLEERDYSKMHFVKRVSYLVNSNWKIYVDNYIDGAYHVPYLHSRLNAQVNSDEYYFTPHNNWSLQTVPGLKDQSDPFLRERVGSKGAVYAFMFPTFGINRFGDMMDTNWLIPISQYQTMIHFDWYYKEPLTDTNRDVIEKNIQEGHIIQVEDETICERVQKGVESRGYEHGRYAPRVETGVRHFHEWLYKNYVECN
eukprot:TRINITY_DN6723_c0_g1_i1.p1 TRINITY_DN6723_c0_g1~~TRINITY_DN6723_c0_g1_i1.p1  ORF type:complete len:255 (-),score=18.05 TRINITY_DN6723_c0_g1_i1:12-776(-)